MRTLYRTKRMRALLVFTSLTLAGSACSPSEEAVSSSAEDAAEAVQGSEDDPPETDESSVASEDAYPPDEVTWIVPGTAGGASDVNARTLQPYLQEALGAKITIENHPGAGNTIGAQVALDRERDCTTFVTASLPHFIMGMETQQTDFTWDDWWPVGQISTQVGTIVVPNDAPWDDFNDLIEDARERPGEIRASVSNPNGNNVLGLRAIENAANVQFNIVPFEGGPEARLAIVGGHADFTHANSFALGQIAEDSRVVAVHADENEWPDLLDDAPTVNDVLGTDMAPNEQANGMYVARECKDEHPNRFDLLEEAFLTSLQNPDYIATMTELELDESLIPLNSEEYREKIDRMLPDIQAESERRRNE